MGPERASFASRFPGFDGLRAIAALSVFAFHFLGLSKTVWLHGTVRDWVWPLGDQGVGIFFAISGFLLYRPFVAAALNDEPLPRTAPFWRRRFARILPAYWIALTAYLYVFEIVRVHGPADAFTFYTLTQNYRGRYAQLGLGIAWTLSIEVAFYVLLPLIARIARARGQIVTLVSLAAIGVIVKIVNIWVVAGHRPPLGSWFPVNALGWSVFRFFDWFAVGMALAVLSARSVQLSIRPAICWFGALGLYAAQTRLGIGSPEPLSSLEQFALPFLVIATAGLLVLPAVFGDQAQGSIRLLLRSRVLSYIGQISYGIYLWHYIFVRLSLRWVDNGALPDVLVVRFMTVAALTLAVATASYYFVERPIIRWSHRAASRTPELQTR